MGGGGGGTFSGTSPEDLARLVRKAEDRAAGESFKAELADFFGHLLGSINARDTNLVSERLEDIKTCLEDVLDGTIDPLFGGSVAKHTYVDGLSDIDSLLIVNKTDLASGTPHDALEFIAARVKDKITAAVSVGQMAVTLKYSDGMQIQLLPAIEKPGGSLLIPSSRRPDSWSNVDPGGFQQALTDANAACGGKLIPTIKLAKAINGALPEAQQLSGYHIESLGIATFRGYEGTKTPDEMLPVFFERAADLVLSPIRDRSGQSVHVDEYLGTAHSSERQITSHVLTRIAKRMRNASAATSLQQWQALFGLDD